MTDMIVVLVRLERGFDMTTKYVYEGQTAEAVQYDPTDRMFLLECEQYSNPQWVEVDDIRLQIVTD